MRIRGFQAFIPFALNFGTVHIHFYSGVIVVCSSCNLILTTQNKYQYFKIVPCNIWSVNFDCPTSSRQGFVVSIKMMQRVFSKAVERTKRVRPSSTTTLTKIAHHLSLQRLSHCGRAHALQSRDHGFSPTMSMSFLRSPGDFFRQVLCRGATLLIFWCTAS